MPSNIREAMEYAAAARNVTLTFLILELCRNHCARAGIPLEQPKERYNPRRRSTRAKRQAFAEAKGPWDDPANPPWDEPPVAVPAAKPAPTPPAPAPEDPLAGDAWRDQPSGGGVQDL
jgi:hypothetical protein